MQKKWLILTIAVLAMPLAFVVYHKFFNDKAIISSRVAELAALICKNGEENEILAALKAKKTSAFFSENAAIVTDIGEPELQSRDVIMAMIHHIRQSTKTLTIIIKKISFQNLQKQNALLTVAARADAIENSGSTQTENRSFDLTMDKIEGKWLISRVMPSNGDSSDNNFPDSNSAGTSATAPPAEKGTELP
ncbi:MAG: hypothetical protein CVV64_18550 [Candidatus Wallbacteria bacterium HGW-Wallbacteria-1]|jgi:hypothetical protein|uniref:SnoaL-like domain-containing protein n=1 Tax=Candidatus Wallbacteria bacterium HGW-Wallbacteria-1 TaxID=2013854 RepID=A0A2N1PJJ0_9BACT|nr:MAG: hypothetical protein CVV64_18550 [Candidatus Wallbacteria bacterium HGW-Wallbacteria-1]